MAIGSIIPVALLMGYPALHPRGVRRRHGVGVPLLPMAVRASGPVGMRAGSDPRAAAAFHAPCTARPHAATRIAQSGTAAAGQDQEATVSGV